MRLAPVALGCMIFFAGQEIGFGNLSYICIMLCVSGSYSLMKPGLMDLQD